MCRLLIFPSSFIFFIVYTFKWTLFKRTLILYKFCTYTQGACYYMVGKLIIWAFGLLFPWKCWYLKGNFNFCIKIKKIKKPLGYLPASWEIIIFPALLLQVKYCFSLLPSIFRLDLVVIDKVTSQFSFLWTLFHEWAIGLLLSLCRVWHAFDKKSAIRPMHLGIYIWLKINSNLRTCLALPLSAQLMKLPYL